MLFTDLVGATELMAGLGDAGFDTVRARAHELLAAALAPAAEHRWSALERRARQLLAWEGAS